MPSLAELERAVDVAFADTARDLAPWPDPHPDRMPLDEEYSRVTDGAKYLIIGARLDAWLTALDQHELIDVDVVEQPTWLDPNPYLAALSVERIVPRRPGALALIVCRTELGDVPGAGITLGVGDPIDEIERFPDCGCDACDSGSQNELDELDRHVRGVVAGDFRRLRRAESSITTIDADGWSARNVPPPRRTRMAKPSGKWSPYPGGAAGWSNTEARPAGRPPKGGPHRGPRTVEQVLANPTGWDELRGEPWI